MNTLNLSLLKAAYYNPFVMIDGKLMKTKKQQGALTCSYSTDKDSVDVKIFKCSELCGKFWFLWWLLFFVISVFGLLNAPYGKDYSVIDCEFDVALQGETEFIGTLNHSKQGSGKAIDYPAKETISEIRNEYYSDEKIKRKKKFIGFLSVIVWIAIIITVLSIIK